MKVERIDHILNYSLDLGKKRPILRSLWEDGVKEKAGRRIQINVVFVPLRFFIEFVNVASPCPNVLVLHPGLDACNDGRRRKWRAPPILLKGRDMVVKEDVGGKSPAIFQFHKMLSFSIVYFFRMQIFHERFSVDPG